MSKQSTAAPAIVAPTDSIVRFSLAQLAKDCIEAGCDFSKNYADLKRPALIALNQGFKLVDYQGTSEQFFGQMKRAASKLKPAAKVAAPAAELAVEKIADVIRAFTTETLAAHPAPAAEVEQQRTKKVGAKLAARVAAADAPAAERFENDEPLTNITHKGPAVTAANKHSIYKVFLKRADGQLAGRASRARMKNKKLQVYLPDVMQWVRVYDNDIVYQQRFTQ